MDKYAKAAIDDLTKKIGALQEKRNAVIRKERERKSRAQERWKSTFIRTLIKGISEKFGADYEEVLSPEGLAVFLGGFLGAYKEETGEEEKDGGEGLPAADEGERRSP